MSKQLLLNCRIFDVNTQKVLEGQSILINGSHIKKVGRSKDVLDLGKGIPQTARIELAGRLVMPGLIDTHVHLCVIQASSGTETLLENLRASETLRVLYGARNARETLESGFTTVRDMGGGDNFALRDAIGRGVALGPRIVACAWLGMTGGQQERVVSEWSYNVPTRGANVGVDGPWEVRKKVRQLVGQGADCIKVFASGEGYVRHPFDPFWMEGRNYTLEELKALVDEAHSAGRRVAAHALASSEGIKNAIAAGADTLEHGLYLDDEDVAAMTAKGIFYVPTLAVIRQMWDPSEAAVDGYSEMSIEEGERKKLLDAHLASFQRARKYGVRIAVGSDTYRVMKQGDNTIELEWMVKAGMSAREALVSATKTASEALGIESMVGSIEEGKIADLLVVDPSPLDDISVLRNRMNLKMIIKNGEIIVSRL
jgi:imidazolonepropionase-like amidohydrolase